MNIDKKEFLKRIKCKSRTDNDKERCVVCGSYAINEHLHGRKNKSDSNLCDVCYWRKRAYKIGEN